MENPENSALLKALIAHQEAVLEQNREQASLNEKWKQDYLQLKTRLESLQNKLEEPGVLLPLGPKAFVQGRLIHTNEITALLGDNWFLECCTRDAIGIVSRRIKKCEEIQGRLLKSVDLAKSWGEVTRTQLGELLDENVMEIREEYDEEKEREWRAAHRKRVREYHQQRRRGQGSGDGDKVNPTATDKETGSFDELMCHLDELELEEDLAKAEALKEARVRSAAAAADKVRRVVSVPTPTPAKLAKEEEEHERVVTAAAAAAPAQRMESRIVQERIPTIAIGLPPASTATGTGSDKEKSSTNANARVAPTKFVTSNKPGAAAAAAAGAKQGKEKRVSKFARARHGGRGDGDGDDEDQQ